MKKILVCAHKMHCGGTETALIELLKRLGGYDVTLLLEQIEGEWLSLVPERVKTVELKMTRLSAYKYINDVNPYTDEKKSIRLEKRRKRLNLLIGHLRIKRGNLYKRALKYAVPINEEFDIALDFHAYGYFLTAYVAKKVKAKRKAIWIHSLDFAGVSFTDMFLPFYDKIFCVSKATREIFVKAYPEYADKAEVFYNFTDKDAIIKKSEEDIKDDRFYGKFKIVSVGRLSFEKGFDIAVDAAKLLSDSGCDFRWFIIGDGSEKNNLEKKITSLDLKEKVILLGRKDNPMPYVKAADVYVQPSRKEGFGLSVAEAKAVGQLIVASDLASLKEQIIPGANGFLVSPDAESFADMLKKIMRGGKEIDKVRSVARRAEILQTDLSLIENM